MISRKVKSVLLVGVLLLMINLPLLHSAWTDWQVSRNGIDVTATLLGHRQHGTADNPAYWLTYELPDAQGGTQGSARVTRAAYDAAVEAGTVQVRLLADRPVAATVEGEQRSRVGLVLTLVVDVLLLSFVVWIARTGRYVGGRRRPETRLEALGDVQRGQGSDAMEEGDEGVVTITGEVLEADEHSVVLDVAGERVVVVLDGHANPVAPQQIARVHGRRLD